MFIDRHDAATQLAKKLEEYKGHNGVILSLPRGGVPVGYIIARELGFPLDIVLSKKIGHPHSPEFAVGSVSMDGTIIDDNIMGVSTHYINTESLRLLKWLKEKYQQYMGDRQPVDLKDKIVVIVDDGIATGNTILAAVEGIRKKKPKKIVVAVPVASPSSVIKLSDVVDEVVSLHTPDDFQGVGWYYNDFSQVTDQAVIKLLNLANKPFDLV